MSRVRRHRLNHPWMYRTGIALVRRLPRRLNRLWVRWLADYNHWRLHRHREAVRDNLAPVLGENRGATRAASRRLFRNYAEQLVDYARFFGTPGIHVEPVFRTAHGYEYLQRSREQGRGTLLVTAHLGFWELGGLLFRQWGLPVKVLTLEDPDPGVHEERARIRAGLGIETITVGRDPWSSLAVARALRENAVVAMLVDRYQGPDAVPVELFGRQTRFAPGPVLYARMTGAEVLPAFVLAEGDGAYIGLILPPVRMTFSGDRATDLARNTQRIASAMVEVIRAHPDQWYNFDEIWDSAS